MYREVHEFFALEFSKKEKQTNKKNIFIGYMCDENFTKFGLIKFFMKNIFHNIKQKAVSSQNFEIQEKSISKELANSVILFDKHVLVQRV